MGVRCGVWGVTQFEAIVSYDTKATPAHGRSSRISRCASSSNDLSAARARSTFSTAELRSASCSGRERWRW